MRLCLLLFLVFSLVNLIPLTHFGFPLEWNKNHGLLYLAGHLLVLLVIIVGRGRLAFSKILVVNLSLATLQLLMIVFYLTPILAIRTAETVQPGKAFQVALIEAPEELLYPTVVEAEMVLLNSDAILECPLTDRDSSHILVDSKSFEGRSYCLYLKDSLGVAKKRDLGDFLPPSVVLTVEGELGEEQWSGLIGYYLSPSLNSVESYHQAMNLSRRLATILRHDRAPAIFLISSPSTPYTTYYFRLLQVGRLALVPRVGVLVDLFLPYRFGEPGFDLFCRQVGCGVVVEDH